MSVGHYFARVIRDIGETGVQLTALEATEGAAGNISVYVPELRTLDEQFVEHGETPLPAVVPELAGGWVVVTATGRRLRDVSAYPEQSVVVMQINADGTRATRYAAGDLQPTSEWNSHLAIHADHVRGRDVHYHAVVHAQPHYLTYLSHHPDYATSDALSRRLVRWEPETVVTFPEGFGLIPFQPPGSAAQMESTVAGCREYRLVVWQKHGVVARSEVSASRAADLVEYAEMAARYEVLNLRLGSPAIGLTDDELRVICEQFNIPLPRFLAVSPEL
jgi:rhamnulose-1-phosphate aldolase